MLEAQVEAGADGESRTFLKPSTSVGIWSGTTRSNDPFQPLAAAPGSTLSQL